MKPNSDSMFPLPGESPKSHFRRLADSPRPLVAEMANRLYSIPETHIVSISSDPSFPGGLCISLLLPVNDFYQMAFDNKWHLTYFNGGADHLSVRATTKYNTHWARHMAVCYAVFHSECPRTQVQLYSVLLYSRPALRKKDDIL